MIYSKAWESWAPRVEVTGKTLPKVEPKKVRKALGAEKAMKREKLFNSDKAKAYLLRLAADFIEDGEFRKEALELIAAAMTSAPIDTDHFYWILESLLEWEMSCITEAMNSVSE